MTADSWLCAWQASTQPLTEAQRIHAPVYSSLLICHLRLPGNIMLGVSLGVTGSAEAGSAKSYAQLALLFLEGHSGC